MKKCNHDSSNLKTKTQSKRRRKKYTIMGHSRIKIL